MAAGISSRAVGDEHVTEDNTEVCMASQDFACGAIPGPLENACVTANHDGDAPGYDPGEKLTRLSRLSEESPELRESMRECELLSQVLMAHSRISARITGQISEEADAIGRGSPLFTL